MQTPGHGAASRHGPAGPARSTRPSALARPPRSRTLKIPSRASRGRSSVVGTSGSGQRQHDAEAVRCDAQVVDLRSAGSRPRRATARRSSAGSASFIGASATSPPRRRDSWLNSDGTSGGSSTHAACTASSSGRRRAAYAPRCATTSGGREGTRAGSESGGDAPPPAARPGRPRARTAPAGRPPPARSADVPAGRPPNSPGRAPDGSLRRAPAARRPPNDPSPAIETVTVPDATLTSARPGATPSCDQHVADVGGQLQPGGADVFAERVEQPDAEHAEHHREHAEDALPRGRVHSVGHGRLVIDGQRHQRGVGRDRARRTACGPRAARPRAAPVPRRGRGSGAGGIGRPSPPTGMSSGAAPNAADASRHVTVGGDHHTCASAVVGRADSSCRR